jgi:FHS family L-fucose permease-like MFS transporter
MFASGDQFLHVDYVPHDICPGCEGTGTQSKLGGSLIVMPLAGGAIMPPVLGYIARQTDSYAMEYLAPLTGFVVVALYVFFGSQMDSSEPM